MKKIPEKQYKRILELVPICCVDMIIHVGKRFVLLKRLNYPAKGKWWVPGGRVEKGETLEKAVLRKAKEETGLKVKIERLIGVKETIFRKGPFGIGKDHTINVQYLARPVDGKFVIKLDSQSGEYKIADRLEKSLDPYVKDIVRKSGILRKS